MNRTSMIIYQDDSDKNYVITYKHMYMVMFIFWFFYYTWTKFVYP